MSVVDRYWEWRRRRALEASLGGQERARELALVAEVVRSTTALPGVHRGGNKRRRPTNPRRRPSCLALLRHGLPETAS